MDSMVQRLRSRSFSKTEQDGDDKLQEKPKRTDSRKDKNEANRKVQFDDRMKTSSKQANHSGRRQNVAQKQNSWFLGSHGSFSNEEGRSSSSSSMSSDTEAVVAAAIALAATADSATSSPTGSLRESPQSTPQPRRSWFPMSRIGEESTRHADREDQRPADSRALVPAASKRKEGHGTPTEANNEDSRALVPGSKTSSDSIASGKGRELIPVSSKLEADGKHLDREDSRRDRRSGSGSYTTDGKHLDHEDSRRDRRSGSGSSLTTSRSRKDSSGSMAYVEGKREKRDAKATAWLEAKIAQINDRYRQDRGTIQEWETRKKTIANMRMQELERRLEEKRTKELSKLRTEIAEIQRKADKRKAEADATRSADHTKVTEMAKKIQRTGKMPNQCHCLFCC